jgi:hypothetical protein
MQAYNAYVENGQVYPVGQIMRTPKRVRAIITVLDEPLSESKEQAPKISRESFIGCMKGKVWMADDFDAPLEDFKEYME